MSQYSGADFLLSSNVQRDGAAGHALELDRTESGATHFAGKLRGGRKFSDGFRQVTIGVAGAGERAAQNRQNIARIKSIQFPKQGSIGLREFENGRNAITLQDAVHFGEAGMVIREVAKSEGYGYEVERRIGDGQIERVGLKQ